jgi:hypothetical protein
MDQYLVAVDAQLPMANPHFDPSRPEPSRKGGGGPGKKPKPGGEPRTEGSGTGSGLRKEKT